MNARGRTDDSVALMSPVRVMRDRISYHETETFDRLAATPWIEKREHELTKPGVIAKYKALTRRWQTRLPGTPESP